MKLILCQNTTMQQYMESTSPKRWNIFPDVGEPSSWEFRGPEPCGKWFKDSSRAVLCYAVHQWWTVTPCKLRAADGPEVTGRAKQCGFLSNTFSGSTLCYSFSPWCCNPLIEQHWDLGRVVLLFDCDDAWHNFSTKTIKSLRLYWILIISACSRRKYNGSSWGYT